MIAIDDEVCLKKAPNIAGKVQIINHSDLFRDWPVVLFPDLNASLPLLVSPESVMPVKKVYKITQIKKGDLVTWERGGFVGIHGKYSAAAIRIIRNVLGPQIIWEMGNGKLLSDDIDTITEIRRIPNTDAWELVKPDGLQETASA